MASIVTLGFIIVGTAMANPARDAVIKEFSAGAAQPLSAERGKELFLSSPATGKAETPSCTSCHGATPFTTGQTRAGKPIAPLAVSKTPDRYTDPKKVAKWFRRNCKSVLGRECTPQEKGDFLTYMSSQ